MEESATKTTIQLNVFGNQSAYSDQFILKEGETLFVGSGASCGINLTGIGIAQFHCMFGLSDGKILIQDCETGGNTFVNGESVVDETVCTLADTITIGQYQIVVSPCDEDVLESQSECLASTENKRSSAEFPFDQEPGPSDDESVTNDEKQEFAGSLSDWNDSIEESVEEDLELNSEPDKCWFEDDSDATSTPAEMQLLMNDEMELLRSEVEFLQSALAAKEQEVAEYVLGNPTDEAIDSSATEKLVCRLEELLEELKQSDERVKSLEDLLRYSEEANQAEQEERRQIESWLSEIENRVAGRESELESEIETLKNQVAASEQRQQKAELQLKQMLSKKPADSTVQNVSAEKLHQLEQQLTQMERLVETSNQAKQAAETQLLEMKEASKNTVDVQALEQKLIDMELTTSRERAAIARERAELESMLDNRERSETQRPKLDASDYRFAAMRDHLREIHEEEKLVQLQKKQNSLSGRITRLLKRK